MSTRAHVTILATFAAGVAVLVATTHRPAPDSPPDPSTRQGATSVQSSVPRQPDASGPPVLLVREGERPSVPLLLESARYEVTVAGLVARTRATLTFRNDADRVLEGELVYPLPEGAVLSGFGLDVAGRLVDGVVVESQQARIAFETEVRRGIDPGLAEWVRGNNFRTRVWPVPARGRRTLRVEYISQLVDREDAGAVDAVYELPLRFGVPLEEFGLRVEVVRSDVVPVVRSGPANFAFEKWQDRFVADASQHKVAPADLIVALPRLPRERVIVETEEDSETYFVIDDLPPAAPAAANAPARPGRIGVVWDASLSRGDADRERDLRVLEAHLARLRDVEVVAVVFRNVAETSRRFDVRDGDASALVGFLRAQPCDGATNLSGVGFPADAAYSLLFTDGLWTVGGSPALSSAARPVFAIAGSSQADHGLLSALASASGGAYVNLQRHTDADALDRIGRPVYSLLEVASEGGVADVEPRTVQPAGGRVTIAGRLTAPEARLRVRYGFPAGGGEQVKTYHLRRSAGGTTGLTARRWAERRLATLALAPDANRAEIVQLGRRFSIVTPGTSLLVLETLDQYVEHGITPPETLPDLRQAYAQRVDEASRVKEGALAGKVERVLAMWDRRVEWWSRTFTYEAGFRYQEPKTQRVTGAAREGTMAPAPAPALETAAASRAGGGARAGDEAPPGGPTISVAPWDPDTPYLQALSRAPREAAYQAYLSERRRFGTSPAFFLDCADFFARRGERGLAIRVLTSIAELQLEDARLLRVLAHRLEQVDEIDLAIELFEHVRRLRPEEPQSHRDLALALDRRASLQRGDTRRAEAGTGSDRQRALSLLAEVVMGEWDDRFPEVEVLALEEANRIAAVLERRGATADWPLDPRLRQSLDVDVRVVLTWDTDLTDMDLWVIEPSGEKCFYGHALTTIGGAISRDFTGGLGPEVYAVRRAMAGDYLVQANFYGSRSQSLTGPTTVQAVVMTNFGRPDEDRRSMTLRLTGAKDVVDIGTVNFRPGGPGR